MRSRLLFQFFAVVKGFADVAADKATSFALFYRVFFGGNGFYFITRRKIVK